MAPLLHRFLQIVPVVGVLVVAVLMLTARDLQVAHAQQGGTVETETVLYDDATGPYNVRILQSPPRAIVGSLRLIIEPTVAQTGEVVENAVVRIFGTPPGDGERQFSPGLNSPVDRTRYFGQLELDDAGLWTIDVEIDGDAGRAIAIAQTTIHDRARSGDSTLVGTIVFVLISVGFVGAGTWLWYSSRRARRQRAEIRSRGGQPRRSSG